MTYCSRALHTRAARLFGMTVAVVTGMLVGLFLALCFVATVVDLLGRG